MMPRMQTVLFPISDRHDLHSEAYVQLEGQTYTVRINGRREATLAVDGLAGFP